MEPTKEELKRDQEMQELVKFLRENAEPRPYSTKDFIARKETDANLIMKPKEAEKHAGSSAVRRGGKIVDLSDQNDVTNALKQQRL